MLSTAIALFCAALSTARAQSSSHDFIHVGIFGYDADGSVVVSAWDPVPSKRSMVFASGFCRVGAGFRELPDYATDAWRFSWNSISRTKEAAVIQVDWQRVLESGQPVTAPGGSVQLTLQWGEKTVLDHAAGPSPAGCNATAMTFEARYGSHPMHAAVRGNVTPDAAPSTGSRTATPRWGQMDRIFRVNLWFVRTVPGKPEEVLANPVLATIKTGKFASAPVRIQLDGGTAIVRVNASFSIDSGPGGDLLTFVTERRMTWLPLQESRDALPDIKGGSQTTIPLPGPDEVISFEMPPVRFKGRPALPDQFAIRVQVTPISPIQ